MLIVVNGEMSLPDRSIGIREFPVNAKLADFIKIIYRSDGEVGPVL